MTQAIQLAAGAFLSGRNRIMNGAMLYNQYGATAVQVANAYRYGGADRWPIVAGGASPPIGCSQSVVSANDGNGTPKIWLKQLVTSAVASFTTSQYWGGIGQLIEGNNCYDFRAGTQNIAVSFWFQASVAGQYSVVLNDNAVSYTCAQIFNYATGGVPQFVTVMFPPAPIGVSFNATATTFLYLRIAPIGGPTTSTSILGVWTALSAVYAVTGNVNWAATLNNYIQATDVQLEAGLWTPFDRRSIGETAADCKRNYRTMVFDFGGYGSAGQGVYCSQTFPTMRVAPTPTFVSNAGLTNAGTLASFAAGTERYSISAIVTALGPYSVLGSSWTLNSEFV